MMMPEFIEKEEGKKEFSKIPQNMILELMTIDIDSWHEVTKPSVGKIAYVGAQERYGEISECVDKDTYIVKFENGKTITAKEDDIELTENSILPMWGWMWQFKDSSDNYWLKEKNGIQIMSDCGFRIYEHDKWGYFFGIDGLDIEM